MKFPDKEIVLAVDPSLRGTGYAVVLAPVTGKVRCLEYGVLRIPASASVSACLLQIHDGLEDVIQRNSPGTFAIESTIYVQSFKTAIVLGSARGAALLPAARHGLEIHEFAPRKIKQAVVGSGAAGKKQVAFMIRVLYELPEEPPSDAADALAVALAYLQSRKLSSARIQGSKGSGKP